MARRTSTYTVTTEGRDRGKMFLLTELPAALSEDWAIRAFSALSKSGVEIPDDIAAAGLAGIAAMGVQTLAHVPYADMRPLLAEMFACIQIVPDPARIQVVRALIDDDIEEVMTRLALRREVLDLHLGFSLAAALSGLAAQAPTKGTSDPIPTSLAPSE